MICPKRRIILSGSTRDTDLPVPLNIYTLKRPVPSKTSRYCHCSVPASLKKGSTGILTGSTIGIALRLNLRTRLTLIRLALIRKPWSFGEGGSRPLYRYLYLHLLFRTLQHSSRNIFNAERNAPLPIETNTCIHSYPAASVKCLCPSIIRAGFLDR